MTYEPLDYWSRRTQKVISGAGGDALDRRDRGMEVDSATRIWLRRQLVRQPELPTVLEVGCGFGRWAEILDGGYTRYVGIDIVPARIEQARSRFAGATRAFHVVDVEGLWDAVRDDVFDVIISITVLQHLDHDAAVRVLQAVARRLLPGGVALLAEWRLFYETRSAVDAIAHEPHMFPKSIPALQAAVPSLTWRGTQGRYILTRV